MKALHTTLKTACAALHAEVDALFSRFDLGESQDYGRFLQAHAAVVLPLERALDHAGMSRQLPDWPGRRRAAALVHDLSLLQVDLPVPTLVHPLGSPAWLWGAAYVLEGSKLGGAVLARRVPSGIAAHYLRAQASAPSWPLFLSVLEEALSAGDQTELVLSAQATFTLFKNAAQRQLEMSVA